MSLKLHNTQIDRDLACCGKPIDFPIRAPCGNRETWSSADWGPWDGVVSFGDDFVVHLSLLMMMMEALACIRKAMLRWRRRHQRCRSSVFAHLHLSMMAPLECGALVAR